MCAIISLMKKKIGHLAFFIGLLGIDQFSKLWAQRELVVPRCVLPNFFYLTYTQNSGAAWSILSGQRLFFLVVGVLAVVFLLYWYIKSKTGWSQLALVMMTAGACGNLLDRIFLGEVRDFLDFYIFGYDFPIFNAADTVLCLGAGLMFLDILWQEKPWRKA